MKRHELKTWPKYFAAVQDGSKTFEYRANDRFYQVGDTLVLKEWNPETKTFSGRQEIRRVTYVMKSGFNLPVGMCIMGLANDH